MKFLFLLVGLLLVGFVSAGLGGDLGLDLRPETPAIIEGANYSINVNNTEHFEGYTLTEHKSWLQTQFDSIYCKLTGCTMTGNIDMGNNQITNIDDLILNSGGKIRIGNPSANGIGISMDGNAFFIFSDTLDGSWPQATNIINNFNNYRGLLMRRTSTGTGDFQLMEDSDGTDRFTIDRYGNAESHLGNMTANYLFGNGSQLTGLPETNTTPTSGDFGFWNRTDTVLTPKSSQDDIYSNGLVTGASNLTTFGNEILIDGGFDNPSDWVLGTAWSIASSKLTRAFNNAVSNVTPAVNVNAVTNKQYILEINFENYDSSFDNNWDMTFGGHTFLHTDFVNGLNKIPFITTNTDSLVIGTGSFSSAQFDITSISLKQVGNTETQDLLVRGGATFEGEDTIFSSVTLDTGTLNITATPHPTSGFTDLIGNPAIVATSGDGFGFGSNAIGGGFNFTLGDSGFGSKGGTYKINFGSFGFSKDSGGLHLDAGHLWMKTDNEIFFQGAVKDVGMYYDGTNWIFNPKIIGAGIFKILGNLWVNEDLTVVGTSDLRGTVTIDENYTLPTTDGNEGDVIITNGLGTSSFQKITMTHPITLTTYDAEPSRGSASNLHGGLDNLIMSQPLNSIPTNIVVAKGTGKVMIMINAGSDFSGSLTITGESIDRNTGASTPADTDIITISELSSDTSTTDGNGNTVHNLIKGYSSSKWFTGTITLSTSDLTLTDVDIYHISFEQFNDVDNITLNTFDVNLYTTNVNAEFDSYLYKVADGNNRMNVTSISELHIGTDGETALANKYWRLRRGNINEFINGTYSGIFIDTHYSNSPAYIEDVTQKIWATQTI